MKTFLSVSAALIAVPILGVVCFSALYIGSAGKVDQRERQCIAETGNSRYECAEIVAAEIAQEAVEANQRLKESSGELHDSWQRLTR